MSVRQPLGGTCNDLGVISRITHKKRRDEGGGGRGRGGQERQGQQKGSAVEEPAAKPSHLHHRSEGTDFLKVAL